MFRSQTLFIVGAGASKEANLPIGNELKSIIANKLSIKYDDFGRGLVSGDRAIVDALKEHSRQAGGHGDINPYLDTCWHIRDAMPLAVSIDNFLDNHQGNEQIELCGKLAIVRSILEAERKSTLFWDDPDPHTYPDFKPLQGTWYASLEQLLTLDCHRNDIAKVFDNVSFITFNYDRCIEHFLFHALQIHYGIDPDGSAGLMQGLRIFHPYGVTGELPWQNHVSATVFGGDVNRGSDVLALASQIKTFMERIEDDETVAEMRELVAEANVVVFLGFAYHEQNLGLLKPAKPTNPKQLFGTTKGISVSDTAIIKVRLLDEYRAAENQDISAELRGCDCYQLFGKYWRRLTHP